jgi:hypothetical protein
MFASTLAIGLAACGSTAPAAQSESAKPSGIDGYGNLKFGMSFAEATGLTGLSRFNSAAVKGCMIELAVRGCYLTPGDNLTSYVSVDGVPYTLALSFNRYDKLTDISLKYQREMIEDPDQKMSFEDCKAIHERTADWLVKEFGQFDQKKEDGVEILKTAKGSEYSFYRNGTTFIASFQKKLPDKRRVSLISHYMVLDPETNCSIDVQFAEPETVERWEMSPEDKKHFDEITKG